MNKQLLTNEIIENMPIGCMYQKIIFNNSGNAVDSEILVINKILGELFKFKFDNCNKKLKLSTIPWFKNIDFNWIAFFSESLKNNKPYETTRYIKDLGVLFNIRVVPAENNHIITYWTPISEQSAANDDKINIDAIPIPVFKMDINKQYTVCNNAFEEFIGIKSSILAGKTVFDIVDAKESKLYDKFDKDLLDPDNNVYSQNIDFTFTNRKGEKRHAIMHKYALLGEDNKPKGLIGYIIDITQNKLLEEYMQEQKRISKNLKNFSTGLASIPISQNIFRFICHNIKEITQAYSVSIATNIKHSKALEYQYSTLSNSVDKAELRDINKKFKGVEFEVSPEFKNIINSGDIENVNNISAININTDNIDEASFKDSLFGNKWFSVIQLKFEGTLIGIIIFSYNKKPQNYSIEELEALAGVCSNAVRRWMIETSLLEGEMQYRRLIDSMQQGLALHKVVYDKKNNIRDYVYLKVNDAFEKLTGLKRKDIIGKSIFDVMPSVTKEITNKYDNVALTGKPDSFEHYSEDLDKYYEVVSYRPGPDLFAIILTDITERKRSDELREKIQIAKRSAEFKQNFLANMSHEIRTPLTGIIGMVDILAKTKLNNTQFDYLNTIRFSSETLRKIIDQILDYSKIEAGKTVVKPKVFESNEIVDNAKRLFDSICKKDIKFIINKSPFLPDYLEADIQMVFQIINNLLFNAVKFTDNGSITLNVLPEKWIDDENLLVKIEVIDTGIGIKAESKKHLFKPFSQLDDIDIRRFEGTGLGLSICKNLSSLLGGKIDVESEPKKGSKFWFTFKAKLAKKQVKEIEKKPSIKAKPSSKLRILYVEDKEINRKVVGLMLKSMNCDVVSAENGLHALELFAKNKFDLILMDIQMPVMDGITATKELKKKYTILPPIIGLSANAFEGDREKYIKMGLDEYLTKPIKAEDLTNLLKTLNLK